MSDKFEDRVKRLFGSKIFESVTATETSFSSSSWSVANGDVERREWNRDRNLRRERDEDEGPFPSSFYGKDGCLLKKKCRRDKVREFEGDLDDLDDDEDEGENGVGDEERQEKEIRSCIGLDSTLDNEEEEDEYDKAALCRENSTERVYMRDVRDRSPYINYHDVVPDFLDEADDGSCYLHKDPRADHLAASARLKEDKDVAGSGETSTASSVKITEKDINNLKPILKRKEPQIDQKPKKRVRFDPGRKDEEPQDFPAAAPQSLKASEESAGVPDYLRNPSKYTRYTFDSSEGNEEETNRRAFDELQSDVTVELPKSVTFMPRKKSVDAVAMDDSPVSSKEIARSMANETDACEMMDEDDREAPVADANVKVQKVRQYRSKSAPDDSS